MSICNKLAGWCAVIAFSLAIAVVRPCTAQNAAAKFQAATREAAQEAEAAEHDTGGPNPLAFSKDLAIWTLVVFIVLFLVLRKFAWPQITLALEERERNIAATIAAADARLEEAKKVLAEHEAKLAAAAGEVRALLDEARRDAESTRQRIEAEGHKDAKDELDRALREIERARDSAVQDLAVASANMAIDLAQKVIREQLTPEKNNQIIRDAVAKIAATPSRN
jgi:F-type H+-transporting ATPase subunit b